jgi:hypothetical protein
MGRFIFWLMLLLKITMLVLLIFWFFSDFFHINTPCFYLIRNPDLLHKTKNLTIINLIITK